MPQRIAFSDKSCYRKDIFAHLENVLASFAPKTRSFCQPNDGHHQAWRRIMSSFECMVLPNAQQGILARNLSLSLSLSPSFPLLVSFHPPSHRRQEGGSLGNMLQLIAKVWIVNICDDFLHFVALLHAKTVC